MELAAFTIDIDEDGDIVVEPTGFAYDAPVDTPTAQRIIRAAARRQVPWLTGRGPRARVLQRAVARQLRLNGCTVSRATSIPVRAPDWRLLTVGDLFEVGGVRRTSRSQIEDAVERILAAEGPTGAGPLSDAAIARLLAREGIRVARRTIGKYRVSRGVPNSHARKAAA